MPTKPQPDNKFRSFQFIRMTLGICGKKGPGRMYMKTNWVGVGVSVDGEMGVVVDGKHWAK